MEVLEHPYEAAVKTCLSVHRESSSVSSRMSSEIRAGSIRTRQENLNLNMARTSRGESRFLCLDFLYPTSDASFEPQRMFKG